jgi:succinoglycan biosynthesis protein ExoM
VSILVATRERPSELRRLLASLARTKLRHFTPDELLVDVVITDNASPPAGYEPDELAAICGFPVTVTAEPRTGIPFARNTAIRHRHPGADAVVFVDDDHTVTPSWLEQLVLAAAEHDADFVAGPSLPRLPVGLSLRARVALQSLRTVRPPDGTRLDCASTGNLLVTTRWLERQETWLDESFGTGGGSDTEWTQRSSEDGAIIVHADRAVSWHWLNEERASLRWIAQRSYRVGFGQAERSRSAGMTRRALALETVRVAGTIAAVWWRAARSGNVELRIAAEHRVPWIVGRIACSMGVARPDVYRTVTAERRHTL